MYCPNCGSEERQVSQFCRACGTDLRSVRVSLEKPDAITASAVSARDEIGNAIADKIRELETARDLKKVAEDVLPQIEKFLESPEQRRLRGIRQGVVTSAVGLGATFFFLVWSMNDKDMPPALTGLGVMTFLIGLGLVLNALLFTVPKQHVPQHQSDARQRSLLDEAPARVLLVRDRSTADPLSPPPSVTEQTTLGPLNPPPSITEQTTHHLTDSPATRGRESS